MPSATVNRHAMHFETHGAGPPLLVMGGWGTFCHGNERHLARGLTDRFTVIAFDHRGIGLSDDDPSLPATTRLYAEDAIGLLDHLGVERAHVLGIVGMGACIGQEMAIGWPERVRSLVNMGAWARPDPFFTDQLSHLLDLHRDVGFETFQRAVVLMSFEAAFYAANKDRLLGPDAAWSEIRGRVPAHERFVAACLGHDALDRLDRISAPTLVVHAGQDQVTGPRLTLPIERGIKGATGVLFEDAAHVVAGRAMKQRFAETLMGFLAGQED